jgi:hypothetical protein
VTSMDETAIPRNRGRIGADVDVPAARHGDPMHDDWIIDESVQETFPASDATAPVRPGSLAAQHFSRAALRKHIDKPEATTSLYFNLAAVAVLAVLLLVVRRRR